MQLKKEDKNVIKSNIEWDVLLSNIEYKYYHDYNVKDYSKLESSALNCSDDANEQYNRIMGKYVKECIARTPSKDELEWLNKQKKITDPDILESLRPLLEWLHKYCK